MDRTSAIVGIAITGGGGGGGGGGFGLVVVAAGSDGLLQNEKKPLLKSIRSNKQKFTETQFLLIPGTFLISLLLSEIKFSPL